MATCRRIPSVLNCIVLKVASTLECLRCRGSVSCVLARPPPPPCELACDGEFPAWTRHAQAALPPELIAHIAWFADAETRQRMGYAPRRIRDVVSPDVLAKLEAHLTYMQAALSRCADTGNAGIVLPSPSRETLYMVDYDCAKREVRVMTAPCVGVRLKMQRGRDYCIGAMCMTLTWPCCVSGHTVTGQWERIGIAFWPSVCLMRSVSMTPVNAMHIRDVLTCVE